MFTAALRHQASRSRTTRLLAQRSARLYATESPKPPPTPNASRPKSSPTKADDVTPPPPAEKAAPIPEHSQPTNLSVLPSLDFDPASSIPLKGGRTGARSAKDSLSSVEAKKKRLGRIFMALVASGAIGGWIYMGRAWEEGEKIPTKDGVTPEGRMRRANARIADLFDTFNKPAWEELLPKPQHKPYTLLLSMDDLLVTSTWDRQHGWRTAKRPGVDYFIAYLSQFYEIVLFTTQHAYTANAVLEQLDPYNSYFAYRLFRESARTAGPKIVKDLTYLNRDLSKVILLDTHEEHVSAQPENAIVVPPWKGNSRDTGLIALIPFLESVAIYQAPDVRTILKKYEGQDVAKVYAAQEMEAKRRVQEAWKKSHEGKRVGSSAGVSKVTLSSLFGGATPTVDPSQPPPTYLDLKRKEAQEYYIREQQWLKESEPELKRLIEEDKQKQMDEMSGSLLGMVLGWGTPPASDPKAQAKSPTAEAAPPSSNPPSSASPSPAK